MPIARLSLVGAYCVDDYFSGLFAKDNRERETRYAKPAATLFVWPSSARISLDLGKDRLHLGNEPLSVAYACRFEVLRLVKKLGTCS